MFERLINLIGKDKFSHLESVSVLVVGLGGVGGYAFEALVRSGIKNITIVDGDIIEESNLNRQLITSKMNIGHPKVDAAKMRALEINPMVNITTYYLFINKENLEKVLKDKFDYVIDACDDINAKLLLIINSNKYKLISSMGTANKTNPALLSVTTLEKTTNDPLARSLRKKVKDLKLNRKFKVVSSTETPTSAIDGKLGTNSYIPGVAGLLCASYVVNDITKK